jgi:hypothetical protein
VNVTDLGAFVAPADITNRLRLSSAMTVRNKRTLDFINNTSKKYQSGEMTEETEEEPEQSLKLSVSSVISVCSVISLAAV